MIDGYSPVIQSLLGTLLTWGLTAAGAGLVFVLNGSQRKLLDSSLGFAAGVMLAASYWSLLAPAIEMAENSKLYGESGEYAFIPVASALFVYGADLAMVHFKIEISTDWLKEMTIKNTSSPVTSQQHKHSHVSSASKDLENNTTVKRRPKGQEDYETAESGLRNEDDDNSKDYKKDKAYWKRILLLIVAITVHNIPEGLAVGVGFGAIGKSPSATLESARNLAIGIGIQNFPEGLAVSLPLRASGVPAWTAFWYGQLSGMVEPLAGLIGVLCVSWIEPSLPYAMAFAAGAMIYVVCDDLIPEATSCGNGKHATWGAIFGFIVMMCLDVGLG